MATRPNLRRVRRVAAAAAAVAWVTAAAAAEDRPPPDTMFVIEEGVAPEDIVGIIELPDPAAIRSAPGSANRLAPPAPGQNQADTRRPAREQAPDPGSRRFPAPPRDSDEHSRGRAAESLSDNARADARAEARAQASDTAAEARQQAEETAAAMRDAAEDMRNDARPDEERPDPRPR